MVFICHLKHQGTQNATAAFKMIYFLSPYIGSTGEKDRSALSHEAFLLMANSQNDMEDWVKAIRRVIWAPFGGGTLAYLLIQK